MKVTSVEACTCVVPLDGGVLLRSGSEIIGAIGVSGASDEEDGDIGRIGATALATACAID